MFYHRFIDPDVMVMPNLHRLVDDNMEDLKSIIDISNSMDTSELDIESICRLTSWGIHATLGIEGNPLTSNEVYDIVKGDNTYITYDPWQMQVKNMLEALSVSRQYQSSKLSIRISNKYHKLLMKNLGDTIGYNVMIGLLRGYNVHVGTYMCPDFSEVPRMLSHFMKWVNTPTDKKTWIVKAIVAHAWFVSIHPYGDGNGRMTRLIEFNLLRNAGIPEVYAHGMAEFYFLQRQEYYESLNRVHGAPYVHNFTDEMKLDEFVKFAVRGLCFEVNQRHNYLHNEI